MQDIKAIVQGIGVELTDEQMEALAKGVRDNYVTRSEMDEKRKRIESLTAENSELAEKAKALDGTSEDVARLKAKVAEYEQAAKERDERDAEARSRKGFEERFEAAIGGAGRRVRARRKEPRHERRRRDQGGNRRRGRSVGQPAVRSGQDAHPRRGTEQAGRHGQPG